MAIIGIDLGTTNTLGAIYKDGKVQLIKNQYGSYLTPSVVSIDDHGKIVVGAIAKARLVTEPRLTVSSFKKTMGEAKFYALGDKQFSSEELSSFMIASIVEDAKRTLNEEIEEVIISVPAYFNDQKRAATKRAGALAGVKVNRIINEPSAAALASYYTSKKEETFMVFDFGGGTLDISIIDCFDTMVEIISVSGDNHLGGDTFHEVMVEAFINEHQLNKTRLSAKQLAILYKQAEVCKRQLSVENEATMSACICDHIYTSSYSNQRLLNESGDILKRIRKCLSHALRDSNLSLDEISGVIMVGGSSKMPLIQQYIKHLFKKAPIITDDCDYLIAQGLGLCTAIKQRVEGVKDYILTDICPFSLGVEVLNENDINNGLTDVIIGRNSVLPCSKTERFYTSHDHQKQIRINILQGEHRYASDNLLLGDMIIPVPKNKKGKESVDVRFTYDINGILIVDVRVVSTNQTTSKVISNYLDEKEIELKAKQLEDLKVHPKDVSENKMVYERLLALYEEVPIYIRDYLESCLARFEYLLNKQDLPRIYKYRKYLLSVIQDLENDDPFVDTFEFNEDEDDDDEGEGNTWIN